MKVLFHLGHPAHFHLFKNVIKSLNQNNHKTYVLIKKKDVLEDLLIQSKIDFINILPKGRKDSKIFIMLGLIFQTLKLYFFCFKVFPKLLIGTSASIPIISKFFPSDSINVNEDDAEAIPLYSKLSYPFSDVILAPKVCSVGKWEHKKINIQSYHELSYLHPNNFTPSMKVANKYIDSSTKYFILRFAKLGAHHDTGRKGISDDIALQIVKTLEPYGKVYITSERYINENLEPYRIKINPIDMHHIMAFASLYIGDSQTMAAESGVLGVPFIRFNDFVGELSYLEELENKYQLGYGIKTKNLEELFEKIEFLLNLSDKENIFKERQKRMLKDKIDYSAFLVWFIENYPDSLKKMKKNPDIQYKFR